MPASAKQLLLAGVTSARDLGAPLEASIQVRDRDQRGKDPRSDPLCVGPFIQKAPYPGTELFAGASTAPRTRARKVGKLATAGVNCIKLIDQDQMTMDEVRAVVDEAHKRGLHGGRRTRTVPRKSGAVSPPAWTTSSTPACRARRSIPKTSSR